MRLNVFLQRSGIGSRREAERLVADGHVSVNGQTATITTPIAEGDRVVVKGKVVTVETKPLPRLFLLHKPLDTLVTNFDKEGRQTIYELPALRNSSLPRLMSVGRLDVNSEGLLVLSTDGPLAQAMMSPSTALERVYRIRVRGSLTEKEILRLSKGVTAGGVKYRPAKVKQERKSTGANSWYTITLTEGKNREIRKLMEYFGCVVNRLIRVSYGPFDLGEIPLGSLREVPPRKVANFVEFLRSRGAKI